MTRILDYKNPRSEREKATSLRSKLNRWDVAIVIGLVVIVACIAILRGCLGLLMHELTPTLGP